MTAMLAPTDDIDNDLDFALKDYHRDILWGQVIGVTSGALGILAVGLSMGGSPIASVPAIMVVIVVVTIVACGAGLRRSSTARKELDLFNLRLSEWDYALERSAPDVLLETPIPMKPGEHIYYSEHGGRYEERHTGSVGVSAPVGAVGRAVIGGILFGGAGAIVGAATAPSISHTANLYNVVLVDSGDLIVTDQRILFMGKRNTIEIPLSNIMRWTQIPETDRIIAEYVGRAAGESYSVLPLVFSMAMVRRAKDHRFVIAVPPEPLPKSLALEEV